MNSIFQTHTWVTVLKLPMNDGMHYGITVIQCAEK